MTNIRSIQEHCTAEIIIDKSRFITDLFPVDSYEESLIKLHGIQKIHPKANHHCYAYIIGNSREQQKFSDDGEPGGTAGMPILNVLRHENITNIIAIVTRYFGGIKLGTGGLIRAYTTAIKAGLKEAYILHKSLKDLYQITIDYNLADNIKYLLQKKAIIANIEYQQKVIISFYINNDLEAKLNMEKELSSLLNESIYLNYLRSSYI